VAEYFKKLYSQDPLFRALVQARLTDADGPAAGDQFPNGMLSPEDELDILREYAITLYKEHKTLKNLFMESLKVTGSTIGLKDRPRQSPKKK